MASDEEDEELQALRLAALRSMKNKTSDLQVQEEDNLTVLREAALATKKQHTIETKVQSSSPWRTKSSNSPNNVQSSFSGSFNHFNNQYQGNFRGRSRAGNSNLIVINTAPMVTRAQEDMPKPNIFNTSSNTSLLVRPQDKWCSPETRTNTRESPKKTSSKFSRFDSSDSESSEHSSSSDSENEEDKNQKSLAHKDDSSSDMDRLSVGSDLEVDDKSQTIHDEDSVVTGTVEVENVSEKQKEDNSEYLIAEPRRKVVTSTSSPVRVMAVKSEEIKSIPAFISKKSKSACVKKVSNRWSESDSDNGPQSIQNTKVKLSWSDEDNSNDGNTTKIHSVSSLDLDIKKKERRQEIENDLRKTLDALQSIKEKRQRQNDKKKSSCAQLDQQSHFPNSNTKERSPRSKTSTSNPLKKSFSKSISPPPKRRKSNGRSLAKRRSPKMKSQSQSSRRNISPDVRRSKSRSPCVRKNEKCVLTSEERYRFEGKDLKFNSEEIPKAKKNSLKTMKFTSKSQEKIGSLSRKSSSSLFKLHKEDSRERKGSLESKENKKDNHSDSSVSSMSDIDSESDTSRSWRNEQNSKKPSRVSTGDRDDREHSRRVDGESIGRSSHAKNIFKQKENTTFDSCTVKVNSSNNNKLSNRSASHIYNDFIDRGFDASNYRKSQNLSDESDSDEKLKSKKLLSVVLPSGPVNCSKFEVSDKVDNIKSKTKNDSQRNEVVSCNKSVKRKVITYDEEEQVPKKSKADNVCDARQLLKSKKNSKDNCRNAVFREEHGNSISVTIKDKNREKEVISKPSVHARLGRACNKVPSLMSVSLKPEEFMPSRRLPSQESKTVKISYNKEFDQQESRKEKYREEKKKKKHRAINSDIDKRKRQSDADEGGDALEKRIQKIKEKNAAILKRQAEIQKDKERFG